MDRLVRYVPFIIGIIGSQFLLAALGVDDRSVRLLLAAVFGGVIGVAVLALLSLRRRG